MRLKILSKQNCIYLASFLILLIITLIPFHGFLTVWLSSLVGHYTLLRLWKEFLLVVILLIGCFFLFFDKSIRKLLLKDRLVLLIILFLAIQIIWGIISYINKDVSKKALFYGLLVNSRYFIFFGLALIISLKNKSLKNKLLKIILYPSVIVILFGLLQIFVLPHNFLSHFGYDSKTIMPFETINSNSKYVRIISTLRGANPLGAYLIVPISLLVSLFMTKKKKIKIAILILLGLIVLFFTFSRSAMLGLFISVCIIIFYSIKSKQIRRNLFAIGLILILILGASSYIFRNNHHLQNFLYHTQSNSKIKTTSDQAHLKALYNGLKSIAKEPLGKGPGTSGPASIYNNHPARIPENYFIQIGEETGIIGLALYLAITVLVIYRLYKDRSNYFSLFLLASLVGISAVNLFLFGWSDDTLSYLWWGICGIHFASLYNPKLVKSKQKVA